MAYASSMYVLFSLWCPARKSMMSQWARLNFNGGEIVYQWNVSSVCAQIRLRFDRPFFILRAHAIFPLPQFSFLGTGRASSPPIEKNVTLFLSPLKFNYTNPDVINALSSWTLKWKSTCILFILWSQKRAPQKTWRHSWMFTEKIILL